MAFYSYIFTANYKRFFNKLKAVAEKENRSFLGLVLDTGWCVFRHGLALSDYLNYEIYRRSSAQRKQYAGVRMQNKFYAIVSPAQYKERISNKTVFLKEFAAYTKREFLVPAEDNYPQFLDFLERNETFMSKPYLGLGGQNVQKVHRKDIPDPKAFFDRCIADGMFVEELVHQHPDMNVLCPTSVNTIRCMTFNDHGNPRVIWLGMRIGNGVNPVDNFHAQGMGTDIDLATGRLVGTAIDKDNKRYTHHPATGVQFDGFQIPCFQEAIDMVLQAAKEENHILVIGWDIALSVNGPLIIEANRRPGMDLMQVLADHGRKDMIDDVLASLGKRI